MEDGFEPLKEIKINSGEHKWINFCFIIQGTSKNKLTKNSADLHSKGCSFEGAVPCEYQD